MTTQRSEECRKVKYLPCENESLLPAFTSREWSKMPSPQLTTLLLHTPT